MKKYKTLPGIKEVRGIGTVAALEIEYDPITKSNMNKSSGPLMAKIYQTGLKYGIHIRPQANISYLFLPQSTTKEELNDIFDRLSKVYSEIFSGY